MRNVRNIVVLLLAFTMLLSSCGTTQDDSQSKKETEPASTQQTETSGAETPAEDPGGSDNKGGADDEAGGDSTGEEDATKPDVSGTLVGVSFPQKTSENWVLAETLFNKAIVDAGYKAQVQFANSGVPEQQQQIDSMITNGAKVIVIGAIDGSQLSTQIDNAKEHGVTIIAYDRLLLNNDGTDYYIAYDAKQVGRYQGEAVVQGLTERGVEKPWKIEFFGGSPDDANSIDYFDGAMEIIKPLIDKGEAVIPSQQETFQQVATQGWKPENAQKRMDVLLTGFYVGDDQPDGVVSPNDAIARAVITAVKQAGKDVPILSGQDSEVETVRSIMQGEQYSTVDPDTTTLVKATMALIDAAVKGEEPVIEGSTKATLNNDVIDIPAFLLKPQLVTKANAAESYKNNPQLLEIVESFND